MAILSGFWTSWWPSQMHVTGVYIFHYAVTHISRDFLSHIQWKLLYPYKDQKVSRNDLYTVRYLNDILFKYLLNKIYFMPFSVNCTDKPCVYKINSSIQANKNISSTLCLSMERNWACPLQFYCRSSEGQPLDSLIHADFPRAREQGPFDPAPAVSPITWILSLQILPDCESCNM